MNQESGDIEQESGDIELEKILRSFQPVDTPIDRNKLIYAAGFRAARKQLRRSHRLWQSLAITASLCVAGLLIARLSPYLHTADEASQPQRSQMANNRVISDNGPVSDRPMLSFDRVNEPRHVRVATPEFKDIEAWTPEQLQQIGITVAEWRHELERVAPAAKWIQIGFDLSLLPGDASVLVATSLEGNREALLVGRLVERGGGPADFERLAEAGDGGLGAVLLLGIPDAITSDQQRSQLRILFQNHANELDGYKLSIDRLIELAAER